MKLDGEFVFGEPVGNLNYIDEDGNYHVGHMVNGKWEGIIYDKNGEIKKNKNIDANKIDKKCIIF